MSIPKLITIEAPKTPEQLSEDIVQCYDMLREASAMLQCNQYSAAVEKAKNVCTIATEVMRSDCRVSYLKAKSVLQQAIQLEEHALAQKAGKVLPQRVEFSTACPSSAHSFISAMGGSGSRRVRSLSSSAGFQLSSGH